MAAATTSVDGYLTSGNLYHLSIIKCLIFLITADSGGSATIDNGETITIDGGTNITTSRSGNTITIDSSSGGTVSSVNVVTDGDSLNVASNTITGSGTMTLNWQGSASQYVDGRGQLVTFPSTSGVTSVSGTAPIASSNTGSGSTTISISQASSSSNGYLSSTDWTTFNNKGNGTVTGTGVSGRVAFLERNLINNK